MKMTYPKRYYDFSTYLRRIFGCRVQKISVDTGLTCPNRDGTISTGGCIYCNGRGSGTGAYQKGISITEQLESGKKALFRRYKAKKFLAYFQSFTNTYAPLDKLEAMYSEALSVPDVLGLSIGTRPDCIDETILSMLEHYAQTHLIWLEYGLQSIHDTTLSRINRGHTFDCFQKAVAFSKNRGIKLCVHMILGLPGENRNHMIATAKTLALMGIDGIKLHLLYVIKNTALEKLYRNGHYTCLTQSEYVDLVCDVLELLPPDMVIQRLTGDPHDDELIAPLWTARKNRHDTFYKINTTLEKRNSYQGKLFHRI